MSHPCVLCLSENHGVVLKKSTSKENCSKNKKENTSDPPSPVKGLFEAFPLDVKLEDGPLAIGGGVVAPSVLLEESIKAIF